MLVFSFKLNGNNIKWICMQRGDLWVPAEPFWSIYLEVRGPFWERPCQFFSLTLEVKSSTAEAIKGFTMFSSTQKPKISDYSHCFEYQNNFTPNSVHPAGAKCFSDPLMHSVWFHITFEGGFSSFKHHRKTESEDVFSIIKCASLQQSVVGIIAWCTISPSCFLYGTRSNH